MKTTRDFIGECESCGLPCYYANEYCSNICEKNAQYEAKFGDRESTPDDDFTLPTFEDIQRYPASARQTRISREVSESRKQTNEMLRTSNFV